MTKEEAINRLTDLGYFAAVRNWAMGDTIMVGINPRKEIHQGIELQVFDKLMYIYPMPNKETWGLLDDNFLGLEQHKEFLSLEALVANFNKNPLSSAH